MCEPIPITAESDYWILDDEGDIMLVVGSSEPSHLRVSSKILSLASDVFKAMSSPRFREGSNLRSTENPIAEPILITFPEDDSAAMLTLCQLLHFQTDMVDPHPDVDALLLLATHCDKYNCVRAVRYASHIWLNPLVDSTGVGSLNNLLIASYLFDCAEVFTKVTCKLLEEWTGSLKELIRDIGDTSIPASIYVALEEKMNHVHYYVERSLQVIIAELLNGNLNGNLKCRSGYGQNKNRLGHVGTCVETFIEIGLWPISRTSKISTTLEQLNAFHWTPITTGCERLNCLACYIDLKPKVEEIREDALRKIEGLCLDCTHHDGYHLGICRIAHRKKAADLDQVPDSDTQISAPDE